MTFRRLQARYIIDPLSGTKNPLQFKSVMTNDKVPTLIYFKNRTAFSLKLIGG